MHAIENAGIIGKVLAFAQNADWDIAQRAYENFTPGMTFDQEGLVYAGIGALLANGAYNGAKGICKVVKNCSQKKK